MNFLRSFTLKVELFAGTDIRSATSDLCDFAERIGVMVEADFNGVKLWARPGDNPLRLADAYEIQLRSEFTPKIAQARDVPATPTKETTE